MTAVPQVSIYVLGVARVTTVRPIHPDHGNTVWSVETRDGAGYFVKASRTPVRWRNEVRAIRHLNDHSFPVPDLYAAYDTTLIFRDGRLRPPVVLDVPVVRGAGRMLRRLHALPPFPESQKRATPDTLVNRCLGRARERGYDASAATVPTHGDCYPPNMIATPDGRLSHFIDFEDAANGDPLIDLVVSAIETLRVAGHTADRVLSWLTEGYFAWDDGGAVLRLWQDRATRAALARCCFEELVATAEENRFPDEVEDLKAKRAELLDGLENVVAG